MAILSIVTFSVVINQRHYFGNVATVLTVNLVHSFIFIQQSSFQAQPFWKPCYKWVWRHCWEQGFEYPKPSLKSPFTTISSSRVVRGRAKTTPSQKEPLNKQTIRDCYCLNKMQVLTLFLFLYISSIVFHQSISGAWNKQMFWQASIWLCCMTNTEKEDN